jgi:hypothetical protein
MRTNFTTGKRAGRGFVIGELLLALLLLAVAVSSLAALMYSVSKRQSPADRSECVGTGASSAKCAPARSAERGVSKLLRSGCATRVGYGARACKDTLVNDVDSSGETVLVPRTDSAAMALLEIARKKSEPTERPDRGFIR